MDAKRWAEITGFLADNRLSPTDDDMDGALTDAVAEVERLRDLNAELLAALRDIEVQSNHTFPWGSHVERLTRINEITQHAIAKASEVTP